MNDYIFLMHDDTPTTDDTGSSWESYLTRLRQSGQFSGGSSIGTGECFSKSGNSKNITAHLTGYLIFKAESIEDAKQFLLGNPVYESGGTVEIRELPRD